MFLVTYKKFPEKLGHVATDIQKWNICREIGMPYWEVLNQIIPNNNGAKHAYFLQIAISREIF